MCEPSLEAELIAEYCGDESLLRQAYAEYRAMQREVAAAELNAMPLFKRSASISE